MDKLSPEEDAQFLEMARAMTEGWEPGPMPEIPEWATWVVVEYPDGNRYEGSVKRLPGCWKAAQETRESLIAKGAPPEVATLALFRVVEFQDWPNSSEKKEP